MGLCCEFGLIRRYTDPIQKAVGGGSPNGDLVMSTKTILFYITM